MKDFFHFPQEIIDKALTHFMCVITGHKEQWVLAQDGWDLKFPYFLKDSEKTI